MRTTIEGHVAREGGGAVFFVSNDRTGTLSIQDSTLHDNPSLGFENYPGIFFLGHGAPQFSGSTVDRLRCRRWRQGVRDTLTRATMIAR